ncbi:hypothetical protein WICPIJ_006767 [Wickerhamomyces pijperi]|uniref:Uncharacterized protein n=1 Tax=Wickerhamomyces pijperi TaxID=599730 RepID=A0A9P8Q361_WICPI|nr:hypothetical protein WICPIJ_006767 [Wickerhamomyces pijperi]
MQRSIWNFMGLTPFFNSGHVVVQLQTTFPGQVVSLDDKVVETDVVNVSQQLDDDLVDDLRLNKVVLHGPVNVVEEAQNVIHLSLVRPNLHMSLMMIMMILAGNNTSFLERSAMTELNGIFRFFKRPFKISLCNVLASDNKDTNSLEMADNEDIVDSTSSLVLVMEMTDICCGEIIEASV